MREVYCAACLLRRGHAYLLHTVWKAARRPVESRRVESAWPAVSDCCKGIVATKMLASTCRQSVPSSRWLVRHVGAILQAAVASSMT